MTTTTSRQVADQIVSHLNIALTELDRAIVKLEDADLDVVARLLADRFGDISTVRDGLLPVKDGVKPTILVHELNDQARAEDEGCPARRGIVLCVLAAGHDGQHDDGQREWHDHDWQVIVQRGYERCAICQVERDLTGQGHGGGIPWGSRG